MSTDVTGGVTYYTVNTYKYVCWEDAFRCITPATTMDGHENLSYTHLSDRAKVTTEKEKEKHGREPSPTGVNTDVAEIVKYPGTSEDCVADHRVDG